jgi:DNA-binding LacI/PurR family transcriptional regulator
MSGESVSIIDVAELAGVSKSTVSRVINHVPGVNADVARSVLSAMEKLGYHPSARRRGPKTIARRGIRSGNILLLILGRKVADLYRMPVFPALLHGVEAAVREAGLYLVLAAYHPDEPLPAAVGGNQVDGALLFQPAVPEQSLPTAVKSRFERLPTVGLMRGFDEPWPQMDRVLYNNAAVGSLAARHLLSRGHTRVAFVNIERDHPAFLERQRTFAAAIREAGGEVTELISPRQRDQIHNETEEFKSLLDSVASQRVTGLFVPTDAQLPALYATLERTKIRPGDIDIIGCNNQTQLLAGLSAKPASIEINLEMVGRVGVQWLLWRLGHLDHANKITMYIEPYVVI